MGDLRDREVAFSASDGHSFKFKPYDWSAVSYSLLTSLAYVCTGVILTPFSHLCENYLPLPNSHLCKIYKCACNNCNGDISLHAWLKITNQNGQWHGRNVLLHFCFVRCAHAHSYNLWCAPGLPRGSFLKKKSVSGGSFIRGKSVKEELRLYMFFHSFTPYILYLWFIIHIVVHIGHDHALNKQG